jgi:hypothetical protein
MLNLLVYKPFMWRIERLIAEGKEDRAIDELSAFVTFHFGLADYYFRDLNKYLITRAQIPEHFDLLPVLEAPNHPLMQNLFNLYYAPAMRYMSHGILEMRFPLEPIIVAALLSQADYSQKNDQRSINEIYSAYITNYFLASSLLLLASIYCWHSNYTSKNIGHKAFGAIAGFTHSFLYTSFLAASWEKGRFIEAVMLAEVLTQRKTVVLRNLLQNKERELLEVKHTAEAMCRLLYMQEITKLPAELIMRLFEFLSDGISDTNILQSPKARLHSFYLNELKDYAKRHAINLVACRNNKKGELIFRVQETTDFEKLKPAQAVLFSDIMRRRKERYPEPESSYPRKRLLFLKFKLAFMAVHHGQDYMLSLKPDARESKSSYALENIQKPTSMLSIGDFKQILTRGAYPKPKL